MARRSARRLAAAGGLAAVALGVALVVLLVVANLPGEEDEDVSPPTTPAPTTTTPTPTTAGDPQAKRLGMTQPAWYEDEYELPAARRAFGEIAATGVRWVVLTPTWYQRDRRRDVPRFDTDKTVRDEGVRAAVAAARAAGLRVVLKPHVDLDDDADRAGIEPADPDRWFTAYEGLVRHYADLATELGIDELVVGTELAGTSADDARWRRVIALARDRYAGPLTYAANFDEYPRVGFWDALDAIGIDAYFPLATAPTTDVDALVRAWGPIADDLAATARRTGKPVLFTEAGYASQRGTAVNPYDWEVSRVASPAEQEAAYRALFTALWDEPWFLGVYWWMWDDLPGRTEDPQELDYTPHGKPAEAVLREWAARAP
jgi:hypothetical protein